MPKFPLYNLIAALAVISCFSFVAYAEDRSPDDLSGEINVATPDITAHAPGINIKAPAVKTTVSGESTSYSEKHVKTPNGASTVVHTQEHKIGAGANVAPEADDMTVDDDE